MCCGLHRSLCPKDSLTVSFTLRETCFMAGVGVGSLTDRKPTLTCDNGTGREEHVVDRHHDRGIVEFRGLMQEPRAEGTYWSSGFKRRSAIS